MITPVSEFLCGVCGPHAPSCLRRQHRRLVADDASAYYLLTCVAGTSKYWSGTLTQLEEELARQSKIFGIPMECWWQADIDARVGKAPTEVKWAYADMLAGTDLGSRSSTSPRT
jgi:hypothetical protein